MPPAIIAAAITGAIGVANMVNSNVQNKAAIKNNENQQNAAVANAKAAKQNAQNSQTQWLSGNPDPTQAAIAPVATGTTGSTAPSSVAAGGAPRAGTAVAMQANTTPMVSPLISKIVGQSLGQAPSSPATIALNPTPSVGTPMPLSSQQIMRQLGLG